MDELDFHNHLVAQLAWVIGSAPLLDNNENEKIKNLVGQDECAHYLALHQDWLEQLDVNPKPLKEFLELQNFTLLGKYFEALIEFWLQNSPYFDVLLANKQISENNKTIGEFDFVIYNRINQRTEHWETAVKFYLSTDKSSDWSEYIGPNANDTLALKINKSISNQLLLSDYPAATEVLLENKIHIDIARLFMKGYFAYHSGNENSIYPDYANPSHLKHEWVYLSELGKPFFKNKFWAILPKMLWLGTANVPFGIFEVYNEIQILPVIKEKIGKREKALLLVEVKLSETRIKELKRVFVVIDNWPKPPFRT